MLYALKWVLENDYVSYVIPDASQVSQVEASAEALETCRLSREQKKRVKEVY